MEESGVRWFGVCGALSGGWCSGPRLAQSQDMLFQGPRGGGVGVRGSRKLRQPHCPDAGLPQVPPTAWVPESPSLPALCGPGHSGCMEALKTQLLAVWEEFSRQGSLFHFCFRN